jgi:hypothetical protein
MVMNMAESDSRMRWRGPAATVKYRPRPLVRAGAPLQQPNHGSQMGAWNQDGQPTGLDSKGSADGCLAKQRHTEEAGSPVRTCFCSKTWLDLSLTSGEETEAQAAVARGLPSLAQVVRHFWTCAGKKLFSISITNIRENNESDSTVGRPIYR